MARRSRGEVSFAPSLAARLSCRLRTPGHDVSQKTSRVGEGSYALTLIVVDEGKNIRERLILGLEKPELGCIGFAQIVYGLLVAYVSFMLIGWLGCSVDIREVTDGGWKNKAIEVGEM